MKKKAVRVIVGLNHEVLMYVCVRVCMYVRTYIRKYVYVCTHAHTYVCMNMCTRTHVHMYVLCTYVWMCMHKDYVHINVHDLLCFSLV
jgi:hypothetical protein